MGFTSAYISVKIVVPATHKWGDCPHNEVAFLKNEHRHLFHITLVLPVSHDDRDLEFFMVQNEMRSIMAQLYCENSILKFGNRSCEMIAKEIIKFFLLSHKDLDWIRCVVSEDDENGAGVMWEKYE